MRLRNLALAASALILPLGLPAFAQDANDELKDDIKDDVENDDGYKPAGEKDKEAPKAGVGSKSPEAGEGDKAGVGSKSPEAGEGDQVAHAPRSFAFMIDDEDFSEWTAEAARSEQQARSADPARAEGDRTLEAGTPRDGTTKEYGKDQAAGACTKLEGTISELREFDIEGQDDDHDMLKVRTADGKVCIVDLGPDEHDLDLENGDLVCVEGERGTINGQNVLFAHEISEKAKITWSGIEGLPATPAPAPSDGEKDELKEKSDEVNEELKEGKEEVKEEMQEGKEEVKDAMDDE